MKYKDLKDLDRPLFMKSLVEFDTLTEINAEELSLINKYSKKELIEDDVYVYPLIICDNNIDRDKEYFSIQDLEKLKSLFLGKTMIVDHNWKAGGQHSRIYKTELIATQTVSTNPDAEAYYQLKGWAYTLKKNDVLIDNIEAGIYKEVSAGFSVSDFQCSICKNSYFDIENCSHIKGRNYTIQGKQVECLLRMRDPSDAYEVSFVAVPAQPAAGVTKGFDLSKVDEEKEKLISESVNKSNSKESTIFIANLQKRGEKSLKYLKGLIEKAQNEKSEEIVISVDELQKEVSAYEEAVTKNEELKKEVADLSTKAKMGEQYLEDLKKECSRLGKMAESESFNAEMMEKVFDKCDIEELKAFQKQYKDKVNELYPPESQMKSKETKKNSFVDNSVYEG